MVNMDILTNFRGDASNYYLGKLCKRRHDWQGTGESLRHISNHLCRDCRLVFQEKKRRLKGVPVKVTSYEKLIDFITTTDFQDDCVEWQGTLNEKGYGLVFINSKSLRVSRIVLERKLGRKIKVGMLALHTCDNPSCFNPNHLYEGTPQQNSMDMELRNSVITH